MSLVVVFPLVLLLLALIFIAFKAFNFVPDRPNLLWGWLGVGLYVFVEVFYRGAALFH